MEASDEGYMSARSIHGDGNEEPSGDPGDAGPYAGLARDGVCPECGIESCGWCTSEDWRPGREPVCGEVRIREARLAAMARGGIRADEINLPIAAPSNDDGLQFRESLERV